MAMNQLLDLRMDLGTKLLKSRMLIELFGHLNLETFM